MILTFQSIVGQSVDDLVLNTYGTLNMRAKFISDNKIDDLNRMAPTAQLYVYDSNFIDDEGLFAYMRGAKILFRTGNYISRDYILYESEEIMQAENTNLFLR